jgi:sec-independent protein translocase protein TatA
MGIGFQEVLLVGCIVMILFGPSQLPKIGSSLGQAIREFRGVGRELTKGDDES